MSASEQAATLLQLIMLVATARLMVRPSASVGVSVLSMNPEVTPARMLSGDVRIAFQSGMLSTSCITRSMPASAT